MTWKEYAAIGAVVVVALGVYFYFVSPMIAKDTTSSTSGATL